MREETVLPYHVARNIRGHDRAYAMDPENRVKRGDYMSVVWSLQIFSQDNFHQQYPDNSRNGLSSQYQPSILNSSIKKERFDYILSNPLFGMDWKKIQDVVRNEHARKGYGGRFGPGLHRVSEWKPSVPSPPSFKDETFG